MRAIFHSCMRAPFVAFLLIVPGCGPSRLLERPAALPEAMGERRLWHTPVAYVYAREKSVAGETERWIDDLDAHVRRTYDARLGKGLVIVVDKGEPPVVDSVEEGLRLQNQAAVAFGASMSKAVDPVAQKTALAELGFSEELYCKSAIVVLDEQALRRIGLDALPSDVEWTLCCPSEDMMRAAVWEFAPAVLEKRLGKGAALATAWAWPLAFSESAKAFRLNRDVLAFQVWAARRSDWTPAKCHEEIASYTHQRALILSPMLAMAMEMRDSEAGTAVPASQPAGNARNRAIP
jgi:hypothetical protein